MPLHFTSHHSVIRWRADSLQHVCISDVWRAQQIKNKNHWALELNIESYLQVHKNIIVVQCAIEYIYMVIVYHITVCVCIYTYRRCRNSDRRRFTVDVKTYVYVAVDICRYSFLVCANKKTTRKNPYFQPKHFHILHGGVVVVVVVIYFTIFDGDFLWWCNLCTTWNLGWCFLYIFFKQHKTCAEHCCESTIRLFPH